MGRISMPQGKGSRFHNLRLYEENGMEIPDNIDPSRSNENITLIDIPLHEAYKKIFGKAVEEYNQKQTRKDRKIKSYITKIENSKNGEQVFYEDVVQWGMIKDFVNNPTTREVAKKCLIEYVEGFQKANPQLIIIGAYIHMDEGSPHLHIDYVPVATGYKRGLSKRNSLDKAMKQMGYVPEGGESKKNNATQVWKAAERARFAEICRKHGLEVEQEQQWNRKNLSVEEYKQAKEKMNAEIKIKVEQEVAEKAQKRISELKIEKKDIKTNPITKKRSVTLSESEYDQLIEKRALELAEIEAKKNEHKLDKVMMTEKIKELSQKPWIVENQKLTNENEKLKEKNNKLQTKTEQLTNKNNALNLDNINLKKQLKEREEKIKKKEQELANERKNSIAQISISNRLIAKLWSIVQQAMRLFPNLEYLVNNRINDQDQELCEQIYLERKEMKHEHNRGIER